MTLYWRYHGSDRTSVRVWRENWVGDQFEVISKDEFTLLQHFCTLFNVHLVRAEDHEE